MVIACGFGCVNLIGEHIDYNEGFVLLFAIACGVMVTVDFIVEGI